MAQERKTKKVAGASRRAPRKGRASAKEAQAAPVKPQTIEIEAATIDQARGAVAAKIPRGQAILSERILRSNEPVSLRAEGEEAEVAFAKAASELPEDAEEIERKEIRQAEQRVIAVDAFTEEDARGQAPADMTIEDVKLIAAGSKGFLGIGKKPNHYEITVSRSALVEIEYRLPLRVAFRIGDPNAKGDAEVLDVAEVLAGGWPSELSRGTFDNYDFEGFLEWARGFGSQPHPGVLLGGATPTYRIAGAQIAREANPIEDCMIATTAQRLAGRGTVSPFDDRASRYTFELIQLYGAWNLAKFVFLLPAAEQIALEGRKVVVTEEAMIQVWKGVENTLFEVYDDLGEGQTFSDETVRSKLVSYVRRFERAPAAT